MLAVSNLREPSSPREAERQRAEAQRGRDLARMILCRSRPSDFLINCDESVTMLREEDVQALCLAVIALEEPPDA